MQKFSIRKLFSILFLSLCITISVFGDDVTNDVENFKNNISSKNNDSWTLNRIKTSSSEEANAILNKIEKEIKSSNIEYIEGNIKILSKEVYANSFLTDLSSKVQEYSKNITLSSKLDLTNTIFNIYVNDSLCEELGFSGATVLPNDNTSSQIHILISTNYIEASLNDALAFSCSIPKNQKKYDTEEEAEDLRLRINIVYIDKDLVQQDVIALSPTTVTTASTTNFRAKGGLGKYYWRLLPAEDTDSRISDITGSDIAYTAGSTATRSFDVLSLSDGVEEYQLNIVVVKARLEKDGSGSKGGSCFIRKKFRD